MRASRSAEDQQRGEEAGERFCRREREGLTRLVRDGVAMVEAVDGAGSGTGRPSTREVIDAMSVDGEMKAVESGVAGPSSKAAAQ
jgi:hypothetical protein